MQRDPAAAAVAEQQVIDVGHERRPFPARRHVRGTEVRHDRRSRQLGDQRRLADLQRARDGLSAGLACGRLVIDRLAVGTDQFQLSERDARLPAGVADRLSVHPPQQEMNLAQAPHVGLRVGDRKDRLPDRRFVGDRVESPRLDALLEALPLDFDECDVDPVDRRAAHDSGYQHRLSILARLPLGPTSRTTDRRGNLTRM
ncbi:MAG: hypothetical protein F4X39_00830 [Acidobacteriia bacterium]|nr:hypothetical protein [Terriglobia bacterium]